MTFLFVASLHHPDRPSATLPADFPSTQPESAWTRELRALGHQARVFWRNVDSMEAFRPLVMRQRLTLARALHAIAARAPGLDPRTRRRNARLVALARDLRPDIVVVLGNNAEVTPDTLARIKRDTGALVVYGCGDSPRVFARSVEREAAPLYDLVIANDATHAAEWRALGAPRAEVLPMAAADPEACAFAPLTGEQRASWACDVGFAGTLVPASLYGRRVEALEALRDLDLAIWSVHEVPPSLRRFHRGALVGPPMLRALSTARIVPNPHGDTMPDGGNMRMFEACALGTLQITNDCPAASRWFVEGEHLLTYRDPAHLRALVRYYLDHEQQRAAIARRGQAHVLAHHTCRRRMVRLLELVEAFRGHRPGDRGVSVPGSD